MLLGCAGGGGGRGGDGDGDGRNQRTVFDGLSSVFDELHLHTKTLNIRVFNNIYVDRILICCINIHRRRFVWDVLCILFEERPLPKVHDVEPKLLRIHQLADRS